MKFFLNVKLSKSIKVAVEVVCEKVFLIRLAAVELAQRVFKDGRQKKIFQRQFFEISCTVENVLVSLAALELISVLCIHPDF